MKRPSLKLPVFAQRQHALFCVLVAVVAAAFANPLIEFASNAGAFGRCHCTDQSNLNLVPALSVGLALGITLLSLRVRNLLSGGSADVPTTWPASEEALYPGMLARLIPAIFAIQIAVLYVMETAEQFIVAGHPLGGTIWLGAPVPISLAAHALLGISMTLAIHRALCAFTQTAVRIVVFVRLAAVLSAREPRCMFAGLQYSSTYRHRPPLVCRIGGRAPPPVTA